MRFGRTGEEELCILFPVIRLLSPVYSLCPFEPFFKFSLTSAAVCATLFFTFLYYHFGTEAGYLKARHGSFPLAAGVNVISANRWLRLFTVNIDTVLLNQLIQSPEEDGLCKLVRLKILVRRHRVELLNELRILVVSKSKLFYCSHSHNHKLLDMSAFVKTKLYKNLQICAAK